MKILIDIGHPAHVHYFRNFINIMESRSHVFLITARDKEVVFDLLNYYNIKYINRGKGNNGLFGKLIYIIKADYIILRAAKEFKPDLFLSFGSAYAAHVSFLMGKPHVAFDDTDHAPLEHMLYVPFTKTIITPNAYLKNYGKKHIRINSYMELCSLKSDYFIPDQTVLSKLNHTPSKKYAVLRLVSWDATHDIGLKGLSKDGLKKLISLLESRYNIVISSESLLPDELKKYSFKIHPVNIHSVLYYAELFIGESLTMSIEAAILGTPSYAITTAKAGVTNEQVANGLLKKFDNEQDLILLLEEELRADDLKKEFEERSKKIIKSKIDITKFMVWFIENYPQSFKIMKSDPNYQMNFT